ncbi:MAG: head-tail connector protein, partial [Sphingomonadaceae bacterium]
MIDDSGMAVAIAAGLDDAKSYLRIEGDDDDDGVTALLGAAGGVAEGFLSQAILIRTFEETIPAVSQWRRLARTPVRAITSVQGLPLEGAAFDLPVESYAI